VRSGDGAGGPSVIGELRSVSTLVGSQEVDGPRIPSSRQRVARALLAGSGEQGGGAIYADEGSGGADKEADEVVGH
jgi:hypothetical protein